VEWSYNSTIYLTSALYRRGGGKRHASAVLPPEMTRYRRLDGSQWRSGECGKKRPPQGFDLRTVQPVASIFTDWAIPSPRIRQLLQKSNEHKCWRSSLPLRDRYVSRNSRDVRTDSCPPCITVYKPSGFVSPWKKVNYLGKWYNYYRYIVNVLSE
jgi:hypothetical protein